LVVELVQLARQRFMLIHERGALGEVAALPVPVAIVVTVTRERIAALGECHRRREERHGENQQPQGTWRHGHRSDFQASRIGACGHVAESRPAPRANQAATFGPAVGVRSRLATTRRCFRCDTLAGYCFAPCRAARPHPDKHVIVSEGGETRSERRESGRSFLENRSEEDPRVLVKPSTCERGAEGVVHAIGTIVAASVVVWLVVSRPALAHHSFAAEFDANKPISVTGTVAELRWLNPHAHLYLEVADVSGPPVLWDFELGSPNALARRGWSRALLGPGDTVTVSGYRAKSIPHLVNARSVIFADGRTVFAASSDGSEQEK
jgi:Family of unknown function (DUF6152)